MYEILEIIKYNLNKDIFVPIYTAFDNIHIRDKEKIFTVIGIDCYEEMNPIYTDNYIFTPVKADLAVNIYAPPNCSQEQLHLYYHEHFESPIVRMCGLNSRLMNISISPDTKLCRLKLKAVIKLNCMKKQKINEEGN